MEKEERRQNERKQVHNCYLQGSTALTVQDVLLYLKFMAPEVDQQAVFESGGFEVAEGLRHVLVQDFAHCFELYNESSVHEQIGVILTDARAVFIKNIQGELLFDCKANFAQSMSQRIFVYLFHMAVAMIEVDVIGGLANYVAQLVQGLLHGYLSGLRHERAQRTQTGSSLCSFVTFCGNSFAFVFVSGRGSPGGQRWQLWRRGKRF